MADAYYNAAKSLLKQVEDVARDGQFCGHARQSIEGTMRVLIDHYCDGTLHEGGEGLAKRTQWVLGFLFDSERTCNKQRMVLIKKSHPEQQVGKWNGIWGHIEPGERPEQTMHREALEEIGIDIDDWERCLEIEGKDWDLFVFRAFRDLGKADFQPSGDEPLMVVDVADCVIPVQTLHITRWFIPLLVDLDPVFPIRLRDQGEKARWE